MKPFSILNKPAVKANNEQAGIVFLEYVIMAFIVTVAVICALWWFYWHLQQMTWEVKQKLDTLKTLTCELPKPEGEQPLPSTIEQPVSDTFAADNTHHSFIVPYADQNVEVKNNGPSAIFFSVFLNGIWNNTFISSGSTLPIPGTQTMTSNSDYKTEFFAYSLGILTSTYTVTITPS